MFAKIKNLFASEQKNKQKIAYKAWLYDTPTASFSNLSPDLLVTEGYIYNSSVYSAINKITKAIEQMRIFVANGNGEEIESHPLNILLQNPDTGQGQGDWLTDIFTSYLIYGESFIYGEMSDNGGKPLFLKAFGKKEVAYQTKKTVIGDVIDYFYWSNSQSQRIEKEKLLFFKTYNPLSQAVGLSPLKACGYDVDLANEAKRWNISMLNNGMKPSGIYALPVGGELTDDQLSRLKSQIADKSGSNSAGEAIVLENGMMFTPTGLGPKDSDFQSLQRISKQEIASVYGIAPQLIGDTESQTFANYEQAVLSLYEDTAYPLLQKLTQHLSNWLLPYYGAGISLKIDCSKVSALQEKQDKKALAKDSLTTLTVNEKREFHGKEPVDNGDNVIINNQTLDSIVTAPASQPFVKNKDIKLEVKSILDLQLKAIEKRQDDAIEESAELVAKFFEDQGAEFLLNAKDASNAHDLIIALKAVVMQMEPQFKTVYDAIYKDIAFETVVKLHKTFVKECPEIFEYKKEPQFYSISILEDFKKEFGSYVNKYFSEIKIGELIKNVSDATIDRVERLIIRNTKEGKTIYETTRDIVSDFEEMGFARAEAIARTETLRAVRYAQTEAQKKINPTSKKVWISSNDNRTRSVRKGDEFDHTKAHTHNGAIELNEAFRISGEKMMFPGDASLGASAGNTINCRCAVGFISSGYEHLLYGDD